MVKKKNNSDEDASALRDLISQTEAAEMRGVSRAAIRDLVKRGRLRSVEVGGRPLVYRSEVEKFETLPASGWPKGKSRKDN
jgi:excisionase family DNA binding protein